MYSVYIYIYMCVCSIYIYSVYIYIVYIYIHVIIYSRLEKDLIGIPESSSLVLAYCDVENRWPKMIVGGSKADEILLDLTIWL